jgi:hypothetical protein
VDLGTLDWINDEEAQTGQFRAAVNASLYKYHGNLVCAYYENQEDGSSAALADKHISVTNAQSYPIIRLRDTAYAGYTGDSFRSAMNGKLLVYELATPTTESADPYHEIQICSRYGTEEFVDAGVTASTPTRDVSIPVGTDTFYPVNVFDYIEELTKPDHDMVADANIASGKYFMVGNSLYLSTQAIAQGAAIVPGTNCTAVSLAEALNLINQ